MEEWLHLVTKDTVVIIDAMGLWRATVRHASSYPEMGWADFPDFC
jgi:hypothetical protein